MIHLEIDGRAVRASEGTTLLAAARSAGIQVPTLCHHEALEDWGGCRLCTVEVSHPDRNGEGELVTSCVYPVEDGLVVRTSTDSVIDVRREVLDLLLARCPEAEEIRRLAAEHGVAETSYVEPDLENKRCILCTLCVRACAAIGANAISTAGRGQAKRIAPPFDLPAEQCVGCLSCVRVCPTDAIDYVDEGGVRRIWGREFEVVTCEDCATPLMTEEHIALDMEKSGLSRDYFTLCPACKRKRTAEKIRDTFSL
jgi:bidirectional [NiFe] hydrogenase diaphorase subunit